MRNSHRRSALLGAINAMEHEITEEEQKLADTISDEDLGEDDFNLEDEEDLEDGGDTLDEALDEGENLEEDDDLEEGFEDETEGGEDADGIDDEESEECTGDECEDEDIELSIKDIISNADDNGRVKLSSINALAGCSRKAASRTAGVSIGNQARGGEPTVSTLFKGKSAETAQQFVKRITASIDRVAEWCQNNGMRELAYKLDTISNSLED